MFRKLSNGLEVFEDRHCGRAAPTITNEPVPGVVPPLPTTPTLPGLPVPVPTVVPTPTAEDLEDLVSDDLLGRINEFGFANAPPGTVPAPPCRKQAPFNYGGETTQYPHVKAGTGR